MKQSGKKLGGDFEREIAHKLTKLLRNTDHIDESKEFYKVQGSGALSYYRKNLPKEALIATVGDIVGPEGFPFVIECKRRRQSPDFYKIVQNKNHEIYSWIDQVTSDADTVNKKRLLIMKYLPRKGTYVAMDQVTYKLWYPIQGTENPTKLLWFVHSNEMWVVMSWDSFTEIVDEDYDGWLALQLGEK